MKTAVDIIKRANTVWDEKVNDLLRIFVTMTDEMYDSKVTRAIKKYPMNWETESELKKLLNDKKVVVWLKVNGYKAYVFPNLNKQTLTLFLQVNV